MLMQGESPEKLSLLFTEVLKDFLVVLVCFISEYQSSALKAGLSSQLQFFMQHWLKWKKDLRNNIKSYSAFTKRSNE